MYLTHFFFIYWLLALSSPALSFLSSIRHKISISDNSLNIESYQSYSFLSQYTNFSKFFLYNLEKLRLFILQ